jgi:hypothetical protein
MQGRRRVSAAQKDFVERIDGLRRLTQRSIGRLRTGVGAPKKAEITKAELDVLVEGVFIQAFTSLEELLEDVFLLYASGKKTVSNKSVKSYLNPKDISHARELVKSSMSFLEWNDPEKMLARFEIFLKSPNPLEHAIKANQTKFRTAKSVRNAITHRSVEAMDRYRRVVQAELRTAPIKLPAPGDFLIRRKPTMPNQTFLEGYLIDFETIGNLACG